MRILLFLVPILLISFNHAVAQQDRFLEYVDRIQWVSANEIARDEIVNDPDSLRGRERYLLVLRKAGKAHPDPQPEQRRVILETFVRFPDENLGDFVDYALKEFEAELEQRLGNDDFRSALRSMILTGALRLHGAERAEGVRMAYANYLTAPAELDQLDPLLVKLALMEYMHGMRQKKWLNERQVAGTMEESLFQLAVSAWNQNPRVIEVGFWPEFASFLHGRLLQAFEQGGTRISHAERATMVRYLLVLALIVEPGISTLEGGGNLKVAAKIPQFDLATLQRSPSMVRKAIALTSNTKEIADIGLSMALHEMLITLDVDTPEEWAAQCRMVAYCLDKNKSIFDQVSMSGFPAHLERVTYSWGMVSFVQAECANTTKQLGIDSLIATIQVFNAIERRNVMQYSIGLQEVSNSNQKELVEEAAYRLGELCQRHLDDRWVPAVREVGKLATSRTGNSIHVVRLGEFTGTAPGTAAARDAARLALQSALAAVGKELPTPEPSGP